MKVKCPENSTIFYVRNEWSEFGEAPFHLNFCKSLIIIYTIDAENSSSVKLFAPHTSPKKKVVLFGCTAAVFLN